MKINCGSIIGIISGLTNEYIKNTSLLFICVTKAHHDGCCSALLSDAQNKDDKNERDILIPFNGS